MTRDPKTLLSSPFHAHRRRSEARQQIIKLQIELQELLEPKEEGKPVTTPDGMVWEPWSYRKHLEERIAELRAIVDEPIP